jgi:hypothetical protein
MTSAATFSPLLLFGILDEAWLASATTVLSKMRLAHRRSIRFCMVIRRTFPRQQFGPIWIEHYSLQSASAAL